MEKHYNSNAIASFVISLVFFWMPLFNFIFCALSIYLGVRAIKQIKTEKTKGFWLAMFGLLLGIMPYAFGLVFLLKEYAHLNALSLLFVSLGLATAIIIIFIVVLIKFFHGKK